MALLVQCEASYTYYCPIKRKTKTAYGFFPLLTFDLCVFSPKRGVCGPKRVICSLFGPVRYQVDVNLGLLSP